MTEVVKVQIPLTTNDPKAPALIYDKHEKNVAKQSLDYGTLKALGDDVKGFFEGEWHATTGKWSLGRRVKDRKW
jgi:hypothetical protein